jgi:hypothetical protein
MGLVLCYLALALPANLAYTVAKALCNGALLHYQGVSPPIN